MSKKYQLSAPTGHHIGPPMTYSQAVKADWAIVGPHIRRMTKKELVEEVKGMRSVLIAMGSDADEQKCLRTQVKELQGLLERLRSPVASEN